jgi:hypothetical protein
MRYHGTKEKTTLPNDALLAWNKLQQDDLKLVLVRDGEVIFESRLPGIRALFDLFQSNRDLLKGSCAADTVTGRAAALFYTDAGISAIKTGLLSKAGESVLLGAGIPYESEVLADTILNRDRSGLCPIERRSLKVTDATALVKKLIEFFGEKRTQNFF